MPGGILACRNLPPLQQRLDGPDRGRSQGFLGTYDLGAAAIASRRRSIDLGKVGHAQNDGR